MTNTVYEGFTCQEVTNGAFATIKFIVSSFSWMFGPDDLDTTVGNLNFYSKKSASSQCPPESLWSDGWELTCGNSGTVVSLGKALHQIFKFVKNEQWTQEKNSLIFKL